MAYFRVTISVACRALCRTYGRLRPSYSIQALPSLPTPINQRRSFSNVLSRSTQLKSHGPCGGLPLIQQRSVVTGKKGKRKTVKAVSKRFIRTGSGKLKYWRPGGNHNLYNKSKRFKRTLSKPCYATKKRLKTLNKMLSGW